MASTADAPRDRATPATTSWGRPGPGEHFRPQLTRPDWVDLCGTWDFAFDDESVGMTQQWQRREDVFDRRIEVPFPFESSASGIGDTDYHPVVWYRRTMSVVPQPGRRVLLHFGAVDYRAHVWVNGHAVTYHEGGHTPFATDITSILDPSGEQVLVVRAADDPHDLRQPRGKQDWQPEPHAIWYDRTSGIWQPVWLEEVPETRIRDLGWVPRVDERGIDLTVRLRTDRPARRHLTLRVVLRQADRVLADDTYAVQSEETQRRITISESDMSIGHSDLLWSPENPSLIDATVTLLEDGEVVDEVGSYTALRDIGSSRDRLLLNGRPYFLRLVLAQNFWPETHLAAPDAEALRREVQLIKDLGFNGVRLHQKVEDPRFLEWCDRLGVLVWAEMPAAYEYSGQTVARVTREWIEVLERDASHPCIIAWVPVNESWGVPALQRSGAQQDFVRSMYHLTKALDPERLVIGNDGWEQPVTDVVTVHDYTAQGHTLRERYGTRAALAETVEHTQPLYRAILLPGTSGKEVPVVISEFGGITFDLERREGWFGYGAVSTPEELLRGYADLVEALLSSSVLAGFCWTQLTDTQQERNGLLTSARTPKVPLDQIRAITTRLSAAVAGDAVSEFAYGDYVPAEPPSDD
ncbi:glycoside hydrolase family 2 TIM barrel-domain containing protein [Knoellia sp. CPCC 206435]|uniref:glycoside hydrolase family 2 TIM barrel-domain containing protein n=1 Tax=Knoellia terrae TaxID=3404797 RepID=UPI003B433B6D